MDRPRRVRSRNGIPEPDFYCRVGGHRINGYKFERDQRNPGVCVMCAFKLLEVMQDHFGQWASMMRDQSIAAQIQAVAESDRQRRIDKIAQGRKAPGWVYYVEQGDLIKIGYSTAPTNRMKAYGPTANLLAIHPGTPETEKETHLRFRRYLSRGREWYRRADALLDHIESVRTEFGDPSVFAYAYTVPKSTLDTPRMNGGPRFIA